MQLTNRKDTFQSVQSLCRYIYFYVHLNITTIYTSQELHFLLNVFFYIVKPLKSGHLRVLQNLSVIKSCPLLGSSLKRYPHLGLNILSPIQGMSAIWNVRCWEVSLYYLFKLYLLSSWRLFFGTHHLLVLIPYSLFAVGIIWLMVTRGKVVQVSLLTNQSIILVKLTDKYNVMNNSVVLCTICFVIILLERCVSIF